MKHALTRSLSSAYKQTRKRWGVLPVVLSIALALLIVASASAVVMISATKTDALVVDIDGDGKADPGDTIEYTVVVANSGSTDATGAAFSDTIDPNTTLVPGSTNVSPLARDDSYETIGNTLLEVGVTASGNPAVRVTTAAIDSLFDNDSEFLGDTFTLKSVEAVSGAGPVTAATESGGSVTVQANGAFSYTPAVAFSGADHFDYVITDDGPDNIAGNADDLAGAGRVTINVNAQRVWYVKNNAAAGNGRSSNPFNTLAAGQTASAANDTIYVFAGDGTTTGQNAGITLKDGQRLIGEGVDLTVAVGPGPAGCRRPEPNHLASGRKPAAHWQCRR